MRAPAGGGEDWVVAELGASELAALPRRLDGAVWLEPSGAVDGVIRLDDPTVDWPGSWRVRGFVAVFVGHAKAPGAQVFKSQGADALHAPAAQQHPKPAAGE